MKIYTEEQLHNTVIAISNYLDDINLTRAQENIAKHLKALEPIKIPSDEEIYQRAEGHATFAPSFIAGAQWIIKQLKQEEQ